MVWPRCLLTYSPGGDRQTFFPSCPRSLWAASVPRGPAPSPPPQAGSAVGMGEGREPRGTRRPATPLPSGGGFTDVASRPAGALPEMERGRSGRAGVRRKRCVIPGDRRPLGGSASPGACPNPLPRCDLHGALFSVRPDMTLRGTVTVVLFLRNPRQGVSNSPSAQETGIGSAAGTCGPGWRLGRAVPTPHSRVPAASSDEEMDLVRKRGKEIRLK